jgi:hypothetical protein
VKPFQAINANLLVNRSYQLTGNILCRFVVLQ